MAERYVWYKPQDQVPLTLEEFQLKLEEFSQLCCQEDSVQHQQIVNTFYGIEDSNYDGQRRGGLVGRCFLGAANNGDALDGINLRKDRHAAELPSTWQDFPGQLC